MSIQSPLKLFVGGCSMITSCSVWMFETSNNPKVASMTSSEPSSPKPIRLDTLTAVEKLEDRKGSPVKDENIEIYSHISGSSITLKLKNVKDKPKAILSTINNEVEEFYVYADSTKTQYENFEKETIKISLFRQSAWNSDSKIDEYQDSIGWNKISELFEDTDEVRVKQLLLALSHRLEWKKFADNADSYNYYSDRVYVENLSDLTNLKIKYFREFDKLKDYVKAKVATCKDDTRACYPHVEELDYLETDKKEYFQKAWNNQNT